MKCPLCNKPTSEKGKKCVHCGGAIHESIQRNQHLPVKCPLCGIKTHIIDLVGIELDFCSNCSGIWFDKGEVIKFQGAVIDQQLCGEMVAALKELSASNHVPKRSKYVDCPVCLLPMTPKNYVEVSGVLLDRCAAHGTWIEKQGLAQILDILASGKLEELLSLAEMLRKQKLAERLSRIERDQSYMKMEISKIKKTQKLHLVLDFFGFL